MCRLCMTNTVGTMITSRVVETLDLTIMTGTGKIAASDVIAAMKDMYASKPTLLVLWDFTNADVTGMAFEEVEAIADLAVKHGEMRVGGKSTVVSPQQVAIGISRVYESKVGDLKRPIQLQVCLTLKEGLEFLGVSDLPDE